MGGIPNGFDFNRAKAAEDLKTEIKQSIATTEAEHEEELRKAKQDKIDKQAIALAVIYESEGLDGENEYYELLAKPREAAFRVLGVLKEDEELTLQRARSAAVILEQGDQTQLDSEDRTQIIASLERLDWNHHPTEGWRATRGVRIRPRRCREPQDLRVPIL